MQFFSNHDVLSLESYLGVKKNPDIYEKNLWKKVKKYQKIFRFVPGIAGVYICNSLAMQACHKDSDIDLFIISKKNRLWTARILLTVIFALLGEQKTAHTHAGKFCLSFFITQEALDFSSIAIKHDIYLAYWIETLVPMYNTNQCFENFLAANTWYKFEDISRHTKNSAPTKPHPNSSPQGEDEAASKSKIVASLSSQERECKSEVLGGEKSSGGLSVIETFGNLLESLLKNMFLPRTQKSFQKLGKPFGVVISENMLKFHNQDQRKTISQKIFLK